MCHLISRIPFAQMLSGSCFGMKFGHLTGDDVAEKPLKAPPVTGLEPELWPCGMFGTSG